MDFYMNVQIYKIVWIVDNFTSLNPKVPKARYFSNPERKGMPLHLICQKISEKK